MTVVAILTMLVAVVRERRLEAGARKVGVHRVAQEDEEARRAARHAVEDREGLVPSLDVGAPGEGELVSRHRRGAEPAERPEVAGALHHRAELILAVRDEPVEGDGDGEVAVGGHLDGWRAQWCRAARDSRVLDPHAARRGQSDARPGPSGHPPRSSPVRTRSALACWPAAARWRSSGARRAAPAPVSAETRGDRARPRLSPSGPAGRRPCGRRRAPVDVVERLDALGRVAGHRQQVGGEPGRDAPGLLLEPEHARGRGGRRHDRRAAAPGRPSP